jgi:hypothetical protein
MWTPWLICAYERPDITMTKEQGQDSIEHLWRLLKEAVPEMISKAGGVQKIGAHKITDAVMRRLFAFGGGSSEGDRLGRAFVKFAVQSIYAESELRERFKEHPEEKAYYERFWDTVRGV